MSKFNERVKRAIELAKKDPITMVQLSAEFDIDYYRARTVAKVASQVDTTLELGEIMDLFTFKDGPTYLAPKTWFSAQRQEQRERRDSAHRLPVSPGAPPADGPAPSLIITHLDKA